MTAHRRARALLALGITLALIGAGVTGCARPEPTCEEYLADEGSSDDNAVTVTTVFLVDVSDNSAEGASSIAADLTPEVEAAVAGGGRLVAHFYGGDGHRQRAGGCFGASSIYHVDRNNPEREQEDRDRAVDLLTGEVVDEVRATEVGETGSALPLLREAQEAAGRLVDGGVPADDITVVLRSDLLAVSEDCLSLDGQEARRAVAEQLVERCWEVDQLSTLPDGVHFTVRGAGERAEGPAQGVLAGHVADALCARISTACDA